MGEGRDGRDSGKDESVRQLVYLNVFSIVLLCVCKWIFQKVVPFVGVLQTSSLIAGEGETCLSHEMSVVMPPNDHVPK